MIIKTVLGIVVIGVLLAGCATNYGLLKESMATIRSIGIIHEPQQTSSYNLSTSAMEAVDTERPGTGSESDNTR